MAAQPAILQVAVVVAVRLFTTRRMRWQQAIIPSLLVTVLQPVRQIAEQVTVVFLIPSPQSVAVGVEQAQSVAAERLAEVVQDRQ